MLSRQGLQNENRGPTAEETGGLGNEGSHVYE